MQRSLAPKGKVVALAASMEHFYSIFALLVEMLAHLVTHERALEPVLRYCDKESKTVKDKKKESKHSRIPCPGSLGREMGLTRQLNVVGKELLRKSIRLGNRVLFHGPAAALTEEVQTWLESGSDPSRKVV